jgi:hypothetical protein
MGQLWRRVAALHTSLETLGACNTFSPISCVCSAAKLSSSFGAAIPSRPLCSGGRTCFAREKGHSQRQSLSQTICLREAASPINHHLSPQPSCWLLVFAKSLKPSKDRSQVKMVPSHCPLGNRMQIWGGKRKKLEAGSILKEGGPAAARARGDVQRGAL